MTIILPTTHVAPKLQNIVGNINVSILLAHYLFACGQPVPSFLLVMFVVRERLVNTYGELHFRLVQLHPNNTIFRKKQHGNTIMKLFQNSTIRSNWIDLKCSSMCQTKEFWLNSMVSYTYLCSHAIFFQNNILLGSNWIILKCSSPYEFTSL